MKGPAEASPARPPLFLSWVGFHGRSIDIARGLGAEAVFVAVGRPRLATAPLRHPVQAARTLRILIGRRPHLVLVMTPPMPLVLIGLAYGALARARVVIDAHSAAVVDRQTGSRLHPWFLVAARRAHTTIVTTAPLAETLRARGVHAIALHDAPVAPPRRTEVPGPSRPTIVMPASWDSDEPIDAVVEMARRIPDLDVVVTGHPRLSRRRRAGVPPNLRLAGQLSSERYDHLLHSSSVVLALTTAEHTMQRAGYEAMARCKPLVTSDTAALRTYFTGGTVFVDPCDPASLAAGVRQAIMQSDDLSGQMADLQRRRTREWNEAIGELGRRIGVEAVRQVAIDDPETAGS